jgi:hypothetical protein
MARPKPAPSEPEQNRANRDVLRDWADMLAKSGPVSRVRLICRKGRNNEDWLLVPGAAFYIPELEGKNAMAGPDLEGMAREFQQQAQEHFGTLTTNFGTQQRRADYKIEALEYVEVDGRQVEQRAWETAVYCVTIEGLADGTLLGAKIEAAQADAAAATGYSELSVRERKVFSDQWSELLDVAGRGSIQAHRLYNEAGHTLSQAKWVEARRDVELARIASNTTIELERSRTMRTLVMQGMPTFRRVLQSFDRFLDFDERRRGRPSSANAAGETEPVPQTMAEHCAYVAEHFHVLAPILAGVGTPQPMLDLIREAVEAGANGDPEPLRHLQGFMALTHDQATKMRAVITAVTGDNQLAISTFTVLTAQW